MKDWQTFLNIQFVTVAFWLTAMFGLVDDNDDDLGGPPGAVSAA